MRPQRVARKGEINGDAVDRFTLVHFLAGAAMGAAGYNTQTATVLGALWEVLEHPLKNNFPQAFPDPTQDRTINSVFDILAVAAGAYTARHCPITIKPVP